MVLQLVVYLLRDTKKVRCSGIFKGNLHLLPQQCKVSLSFQNERHETLVSVCEE